MNMSKSRGIQAKMPSPKVILNAFWLVTVKVLNSYIVERKREKSKRLYCRAGTNQNRLENTGRLNDREEVKC